MTDRPQVISLGAGVQSSTMLLMAVRGELEGIQPDVAVFADTGAEPQSVYTWLDFLKREAGERVEIVTVSNGNLEQDSLERAAGDGFVSVPLYLSSPSGRRDGALRRQCTREYKLEPIYRELRARGYRKVDMLVGITLDEVQRMKPARPKWVRNRWPLIDAGMTRRACVEWLKAHNYPEPPKSTCVFCPFHSDATWRRRREEEPEEFARAVAFDEAMRQLPRVDRQTFVHRSLEPLATATLAPEDAGQEAFEFVDECEGMCGS